MPLEVLTSQRIARPVAAVFDAVVDPEQMAGYFITRGSARMQPGETVTWLFGDQGEVRMDVEVQEVQAPQVVRFVWSASGEPKTVHMEFRAESETVTEVTVREGEFGTDARGLARYGEQLQGWVHMLTCLKAWLEYEKINLRALPDGPYDMEVECHLRASARDLYRAWTAEWDRWFAMPGYAETTAAVGAPYWFLAGSRDGERYPHYGRFLLLEADRRIQQTWMNPVTRGCETTVEVTFDPVPGGTRVRLRHLGFPDRVTCKRHEDAWPNVLAHLDRFVCGDADVS